MTIICAKGGILAADSGAWGGSSGNIKVGHTSKLAGPFIKTSRVFGTRYAGAACGSSTACLYFRQWLAGEADQGSLALHSELSYPVDEDFEALVITATGVFWLDSRLRAVSASSNWLAIGAAQDFALGAMAAGCSAIEAVSLTIEHTGDAWGEVTSIDLNATLIVKTGKSTLIF